MPMEASWCLASPIVASYEVDAGLAFATFLAGFADWDTALLSGINEKCSLFQAMIYPLVNRFKLYRGSNTVRLTASLEGGADGFLSRRTSRFRNNLRRALRRAREAGLTFEEQTGPIDEWQGAFTRMMAVEKLSWKGLSGQGVDEGPMRQFYDGILALTAPAGKARWIIARRDDRDVGFIFGAVVNDTYRGYQFSFDDRYRDLSPGHVLQYRMIELLCEEGVRWYDLGTEMDYKRAWSDRELETTAILIRR